VGSFTKALVEGVSYYTKNPDEKIGLMNPLIGPYHIKDINFVAAFDVDERKVGKKLHEAIFAGSNITLQITDPIEYDVVVHRGPTLDGVAAELHGSFVNESQEPVTDIVNVLKQSKADVVVNLIPTGGEQATVTYAEAALEAGCSFINCIPTPLVTVENWKQKFEQKGLVLLGDDIKSQLGATMLNRILLDFLKHRGIKVTKSEQENIGGNADHYNLLYRAEAKEKSKREALSHFLEEDTPKPVVKFAYTGTPSGHKTVKINIEGEMFGRTQISISSTIEDEISINGAGTLVDAIRAAKLLVDTGRQSQVDSVCPFLFKSPPKHLSDSQSVEAFKNIISQN
jgi:myo-inositol-1-phosphate synthase